MIDRNSLKRTMIAVLFAAAATLGATNALPGGAAVASLIGVVAADAQDPIKPEGCSNTSCTSPTTCTYRAGETCRSDGSACTVKNC